MRDLKRIDRILEKIGNKWKENPDMRLGQLLINLGVITDSVMNFYFEDSEVEKILNKDKFERGYEKSKDI